MAMQMEQFVFPQVGRYEPLYRCLHPKTERGIVSGAQWYGFMLVVKALMEHCKEVQSACLEAE